MLKLTSRHTPRISNGLAVFAALLLLVSAISGFSGSGLPAKDSADQMAGIDTIPTQTVTSETPGGNSHEKNKSFKVSLFLFRID